MNSIPTPLATVLEPHMRWLLLVAELAGSAVENHLAKGRLECPQSARQQCSRCEFKSSARVTGIKRAIRIFTDNLSSPNGNVVYTLNSWAAPNRQQQFVRTFPAVWRVERAQLGFDLGPGRFFCRRVKPTQNLQDRARRVADEVEIVLLPSAALNGAVSLVVATREKPACRNNSSTQSRLAEAEQAARLIGIARRQTGMLERGRNQDAHARVLVGRRKHHGAGAAAWLERAIHFPQPLAGIGKEHQAQPTNRRIENGVRDLQIFAVRGHRLDIAVSGMARTIFGELQNGRR